MATFDFQSGAVFGLSFKEQDARKMRHILRHFDRLPDNGGDRITLFLRLQTLEAELDEEDVTTVKEWLASGGDLITRPQPVANQVTSIPQHNFDNSNSLAGLGWDEYGTDQAMDGFMVGQIRNQTIHEDEDDENDEEEEEEEEDENENQDSGSLSNTDSDENSSLLDGNDSNEDISPLDEDSPKIHIECIVCMELHPSENITYYITGSCDHGDAGICHQCLDTAISTTIEYGTLDCIQCPLCTATLTFNDVRNNTSESTFERYEYLRENANRPANYVMCLGSNCGSGQIHDGPEPLMICERCSFQMCVRHKLPWHEGFACEEFDKQDSQIERLEEAEATAKLLAKNSRLCPQCKQCVVRSEGCDHMQCRCGNAWCYLCGADWENIIRMGNSAHARTCRNHPDSSRLRRDQIVAEQDHLTELAHGGPVNQILQEARTARNENRRVTMRPLAAAAAEKRMKEQHDQQGVRNLPVPKKKRVKLTAPWEET